MTDTAPPQDPPLPAPEIDEITDLACRLSQHHLVTMRSAPESEAEGEALDSENAVLTAIHYAVEKLVRERADALRLVAELTAERRLAELERAPGWVMVPAEPTDEMIDAGQSARRGADSEDHICHIYHDMLAAAPPAPGKGTT